MNHPRDEEYTAEDVSLNLNAAIYHMELIPSQVWLIQQSGHSYPEYIQIKAAGCSIQGARTTQRCQISSSAYTGSNGSSCR